MSYFNYQAKIYFTKKQGVENLLLCCMEILLLQLCLKCYYRYIKNIFE